MNQSASGPKAGKVLLRKVRDGDLPLLFEHQRDPVANEMAAFPAREKEAFMAHWGRILGDESVIKSTIQFGAEVAGYVVCFEEFGRLLIGYWFGRKFWVRVLLPQRCQSSLPRSGLDRSMLTFPRTTSPPFGSLRSAGSVSPERAMQHP